MKTLLLSLMLQPGQSEFRPVTEIPASEQLPSAPLLIAAYAFVWIAVFAYVWLMWRRLGKVERELKALSARVPAKR
ncbi:MAG TPA: CcmD family protein [Vicinamibacterales bacterium]|nr:CcmD family protein [Vicinamibacterales bacterium]